MAMSGGAKLAIGCGAVVVVAGVAAVAVVVGGAYWVKGKTQGFVAHAERLSALQAQANAYPFTPPADGILAESRLESYLTVRKSQTAFVESHHAELVAMSTRLNKPGARPGLTDITEGIGLMSDVEQNFYTALAAEKMSSPEYQWIVYEVYRDELESEVEKKNAGKTLSQSTADSADAAVHDLKEHQSDPSSQNLPPAFAQSSEKMSAMLSDIAAQAKSGAKVIDPPHANVELVRKYDADIHKYALSGRESSGL